MLTGAEGLGVDTVGGGPMEISSRLPIAVGSSIGVPPFPLSFLARGFCPLATREHWVSRP